MLLRWPLHFVLRKLHKNLTAVLEHKKAYNKNLYLISASNVGIVILNVYLVPAVHIICELFIVIDAPQVLKCSHCGKTFHNHFFLVNHTAHCEMASSSELKKTPTGTKV